jgi:methanogen homoaconitase small subunit
MAKVWIFGDNVDTDQILPGRYAPYMTSEEEFFRYAFAEYRPDFAPGVEPGDIIVAGRNFGCGSSREYAPRALKKCGIVAIIAESFARIFFRNALNLGIWLFEAPGLAQELEEGQEVELDPTRGELRAGERVFQLRQPPRFVHEILKEGTIVEYFRRHRRFPEEE